MKAIIVEIGTDGSTKVEAVGFKGVGCEAASKAIEEALGTVANRTKKSEWYQQDLAVNKLKTGR